MCSRLQDMDFGFLGERVFLCSSVSLDRLEHHKIETFVPK